MKITFELVVETTLPVEKAVEEMEIFYASKYAIATVDKIDNYYTLEIEVGQITPCLLVGIIAEIFSSQDNDAGRVKSVTYTGCTTL